MNHSRSLTIYRPFFGFPNTLIYHYWMAWFPQCADLYHYFQVYLGYRTHNLSSWMAWFPQCADLYHYFQVYLGYRTHNLSSWMAWLTRAYESSITFSKAIHSLHVWLCLCSLARWHSQGCIRNWVFQWHWRQCPYASIFGDFSSCPSALGLVIFSRKTGLVCQQNCSCRCCCWLSAIWQGLKANWEGLRGHHSIGPS